MELKELLPLFGNFGGLAALVIVLLLQFNKMQNKLLDIVEKNTKAFDELKAVIEKCRLLHNKECG